jgi:hypothetical protein
VLRLGQHRAQRRHRQGRRPDHGLGHRRLAGRRRLSPQEGDTAKIALVFESRFVRNGRGAPGSVVPPLKAQSGLTGKGDSAPLVIADPLAANG